MVGCDRSLKPTNGIPEKDFPLLPADYCQRGLPFTSSGFHPRLRGRSRFCAGITRCSPNFRVTRPRRPPTKATSVLLPADSAGSSGFWGHYDCQLDANGVPSETEYVVGLEGVSFQKRQLALTFTTSILGKWTVSKNKGLVR